MGQLMEQHMVKPESIEGIFNHLITLNQPLLELGGGTGNLTTELYSITQDIIVWELDRAFTCPQSLSQVMWEYKNIMELKKEDIQNRMIVAFPPYECLSHILQIIGTQKAILMMSEKKLRKFEESLNLNYSIIKTLEGQDFIPISSGIHHIVLLNPNK